MTIKKINKKDFDGLLKSNPDKARDLLKKEDGTFYEKVQMGDWEFVIIDQLTSALLQEKADTNCDPYIVLSDVKFNCSIQRNVFINWYFFGTVDFNESVFHENVSFMQSRFLQETRFNTCVFSKDTDFSYTVFYENVDFFMARFKGVTQFIGISLFKDLGLNGSTWMDKSYFDFSEIKGIVNFTKASFRGETSIDITQLCKHGNLSYPQKLIRLKRSKSDQSSKKDRYKAAVENLHFLKQLLGNNAYYDAEDHIYYWFKVFSRKARPLTVVDFFIRPLEILFLDVCSGYFTKPIRVLFTIFLVLFCSFLIYSGSVFLGPDTFGSLVGANGVTIEIMVESKTIKLHEAVREIIYFDLITFSTIGYGDIHPTKWLKLYAGIEGIAGVMLMSLLLVTATKKVLW